MPYIPREKGQLELSRESFLLEREKKKSHPQFIWYTVFDFAKLDEDATLINQTGVTVKAFLWSKWPT